MTVERMKEYQWKKSNSHTQSKIGVFDKDFIPTPMSCHVDMGTLGEIEESEYDSLPTLPFKLV